MKISIALLIPLLVFVMGSCNEDEQPGYDQAINPLWEYNFNVGPTNGITPVVYKDRVIFSSSIGSSTGSSGNDKLIALGKSDGELLWEWSDHFESSYESFGASNLKPIYQDVMALTIGSRNFAVNLSTGKTVWKNRNANTTSSSDLTNLGSHLFRTDITSTGGRHDQRIMKSDFLKGEWQQVYSVDGTDRQGLEVPSFYFEPDGDTVLIFTNTVLKGDQVIPYLISYNKTKKKENYTAQLESNPNGFSAVDWFPIIKGEQVYIAVDKALVCYNVVTGERMWERQLNANLLAAGFILVNDRIYANSEGYGYVWCIDAQNGNVIWKKTSPGTSSQLQFYNNTIYFVGGTDLNVMDASTGSLLATIKAPSSYKDSNDFFSYCTIDPETGMLFITSYSTAYCYPPYR